MKKITTLLMLTSFVFSAAFSTFAQNARGVAEQPAVKGEFVQFERIEAISQGEGVFIRWVMKSETRNLGFYVYRVGENGLELANEIFITGSAMKEGPPTKEGEKYEFFDVGGALGTAYVIQSISMDGRRVLSEYFSTKHVESIESIAGRSVESLENIAKNQNGNLRKTDLSLPPALRTEVESNLLPPDLVTHRWVVSQPGAKIAVRADGFYRITRTQLLAAGFPVEGNSSNWRLFLEGNEQAIIIGADNQYIEFYGKGIDTIESDTRIYNLIADAVPGKRIQTKILRPIGGNVVSNNYRVAAEKKERKNYNSTIINGEAENYWGRDVFADPVASIPFNITGIDLSSRKALVTIKMQGGPQNFGEHVVRAAINGREIGFLLGSLPVPFSGEFLVPTSFFIEGTNSLELNSTNSADYNYFDSITVSYARKYLADQNRISFYTPGYRRVDLTGFTSPNIRIFDTTFDGTPTEITNLPIEQNGATYTVRLPSSRPAVMYGIDSSDFLASPAVTPNNPSILAAATNRADLIIISHSAPDFLAAAETWADYRRAQGFTVKIVDVADVFDEFNFGVASAVSINSFLNHAWLNWQTPKPQYVLLFGDGSYDPRNYEALGYFNMVPPKMVSFLLEESGSDEALADFDNDGVAEMAIGRIPARTASEITMAFNKTRGFETPGMQSFNRGAAFAFDMPDVIDFEDMSQSLRNQLPASMPATFVGRGLPFPYQNTPDPAAQANLMNAMNTGKYIVNYSGHGSAGLWASPSFFGNNNVPDLNNAPMHSIFTMLTCLNGYFIRPKGTDECIAERLLNLQTGGAVATWASSARTFPEFQLPVGVRFYNQLAAGNITRIGDLIKDAKATVPFGGDVGYSWVLLGDPMLKVRP